MQSRSRAAVLWDMDGVIVDTADDHFRAWQRLWHEEGIPFNRNEFQETFGRRNDDIIPQVVGRPLTAEAIQALSDRKERYYRDEVKNSVRALPGVIRLVRVLAEVEVGVSQAVATSAPYLNVKLILEALGLVEIFDAQVTAEDVKRGKPDPEIFLKAAGCVNAAPARCLVIEDSVFGVQAAKSAGMVCLAVTNTHPPASLKGADYIVSSLEEVTANQIIAWLNPENE